MELIIDVKMFGRYGIEITKLSNISPANKQIKKSLALFFISVKNRFFVCFFSNLTSLYYVAEEKG
jgi:hypothetical protein